MTHSHEAYDVLIETLNGSFDTGKTRSYAWRYKQLLALESMLADHEQDFADALKQDLGKAAQEAWMTEISFVQGEAAHARKHLLSWIKARPVSTPAFAQPGRSWVQPEPLGTVLILGAWNYPLQLSLSPLVAALSAGNCAVIKPSELSPATSAAVARWVPEYLDPDCIQVVEGGIDETTALLEKRFDHILYTGGGHVGRIVMTAAAKHLTPVTLELGGKSPCVVLPDANLEVTARRITWGKYMNAGQTCIAPDYLITDKQTEQELLPLIEANIREMFGDNPKTSPDYGRIVNHRHFQRINQLIDLGKTAIGGDSDEADKYIAPTVMPGVTQDSPVMQEEIFGPVLPIVRSTNLDDAIQFIKAGEKPLSAYIFSGNKSSQKQFSDAVSAGSICINDVVIFMTVPDLPFGGVGHSGMGQYKGEAGFRTFSHHKAVMSRSFWMDVKIRYAPYTSAKFKWLRRLR